MSQNAFATSADEAPINENPHGLAAQEIDTAAQVSAENSNASSNEVPTTSNADSATETVASPVELNDESHHYTSTETNALCVTATAEFPSEVAPSSEEAVLSVLMGDEPEVEHVDQSAVKQPTSHHRSSADKKKPKTPSSKNPSKSEDDARQSKKRPRALPTPEETQDMESRTAFRHAQRMLRKSAPSLDLKSALQRSFSASSLQQQNAESSFPPSPLLATRNFSSFGSGGGSVVPSPTSQVGTAATLYPTTITESQSTLSPLTPPPSPAVVVGGSAAVDVTSRFLAKLSEQRKGDLDRIIQRQLSAGSGATASGVGMLRHRSATTIRRAGVAPSQGTSGGFFLSTVPSADNEEEYEEEEQEQLHVATDAEELSQSMYASKENSMGGQLKTASYPHSTTPTTASDMPEGKNALLKSFLQDDASRVAPRLATTNLPLSATIGKDPNALSDDSKKQQSRKEDELLASLARKHHMLKLQRALKAEEDSKKQDCGVASSTVVVAARTSFADGVASSYSSSTAVVHSSSNAKPLSSAAAAAPVEIVRNLTSVAQRRAAALMSNVSLTDVNFLKRTNSVDHSNSQSMVFASSSEKKAN